MSAHIYREYDIRGVADRDLDDDTVRGIGRGLARLLRPASGQAPRLVVGRDCRRSGPRLFAALLEGLISGGAHVTDIGVVPTPLVYFGVHHLEADGGIMITGSHNPPEDNGFKIMKGKDSFFGPQIQELRQLVEKGDLPPAPRGSIETSPIEEDYLEKIREAVSLTHTDLKVVLDAGNGAGGPLGLRALRAVGLTPMGLYCDLNGSFPNHHPDPTVLENLEDLIETVRREGAHVGVAYDGDGDRLGVVDSDGTVIYGDRLLALFARDVLAARPGSTVLGEVKCSQSVYDDIAKHGGKPIMWRTGHSLIKTKMKQERAALAGEMSGHFFFADRYYGFDDAIYATLRLAEILTRKGQTISELLADLPQGHSTPEIRMDCPDAVKRSVVAQVHEQLQNEDAELSDIDGVRVSYADGSWALVRASNTGPVLVLRFEAPSSERLAELRQRVEAMVREATSTATEAHQDG